MTNGTKWVVSWMFSTSLQWDDGLTQSCFTSYLNASFHNVEMVWGMNLKVPIKSVQLQMENFTCSSQDVQCIIIMWLEYVATDRKDTSEIWIQANACQKSLATVPDHSWWFAQIIVFVFLPLLLKHRISAIMQFHENSLNKKPAVELETWHGTLWNYLFPNFCEKWIDFHRLRVIGSSRARIL